MQDAKSSLMGDSMYVLQLGAKSVVFSYMCGWELDGNIKVQQKPRKESHCLLICAATLCGPHCIARKAVSESQLRLKDNSEAVQKKQTKFSDMEWETGKSGEESIRIRDLLAAAKAAAWAASAASSAAQDASFAAAAAAENAKAALEEVEKLVNILEGGKCHQQMPIQKSISSSTSFVGKNLNKDKDNETEVALPRCAINCDKGANKSAEEDPVGGKENKSRTETVVDCGPPIQKTSSIGQNQTSEGVPGPDAVAQAEEAKAKANELFKTERYHLAIEMYNKAIELNPTNAVYFANRSISHLRLENCGFALADASKAIETDKTYLNAYYRWDFCSNFET